MNKSMASKTSEERRILLIGKTGVGKSSTGNSILGKKDHFQKGNYGKSITRKCTFGSALRFDKKLVVVDTPGFCDTELTDEEIQAEIVRSTALVSPGFHALVFVIAPGRFTEESKRTIELFFKTFGFGIHQYTIILMTRLDDLVDDGINSIDEYIKTAGDELVQMKYQCEHRVIAFNNRAKEPEMSDQVFALILMIDDMIASHKLQYFSHERFRQMERCLRLLYLYSDLSKRLGELGRYVAGNGSNTSSDENRWLKMVRNRELKEQEGTSVQNPRGNNGTAIKRTSIPDEAYVPTSTQDISNLSASVHSASDVIIEADDEVVQKENKGIDRDKLREKLQNEDEQKGGFFSRVLQTMKRFFKIGK